MLVSRFPPISSPLTWATTISPPLQGMLNHPDSEYPLCFFLALTTPIFQKLCALFKREQLWNLGHLEVSCVKVTLDVGHWFYCVFQHHCVNAASRCKFFPLFWCRAFSFWKFLAKTLENGTLLIGKRYSFNSNVNLQNEGTVMKDLFST